MAEQARESVRILVVDDEQPMRDVVAAGLTRAGYECATAESADQAAELLDQASFDLVLLDVNMPGKSGIEFLSDLRGSHPDLPVIMFTGEADADTAANAMREGATDYATKPAAIPELVTRIESAIEKRTVSSEDGGSSRA